MGGGHKAGRRRAQQNRRKEQQGTNDRSWLLNVCLTAFAAGTLVAFGHWFSSTPGRRLGGGKRRFFSREEGFDDVQDKDNRKSQSQTKPKSLAELRLQRLQAAEARIQSPRIEPSAARLTPLGMILELTQKVDKMEEEANLLLAKVSFRVMTTSEEKTQMQLLELLALLQLDVDAVQGDESVRPHRKSLTSRIQTLTVKLDQLKHSENSSTSDLAEFTS